MAPQVKQSECAKRGAARGVAKKFAENARAKAVIYQSRLMAEDNAVAPVLSVKLALDVAAKPGKRAFCGALSRMFTV